MDAHFFTHNRKQLAKKAGHGLVVIAGNLLMQRSSDTTFPFKQDSNAWYVSGIEEPGVVICMDIDAGEEFVILPDRTGVRAIFDGEINEVELQNRSGIKKYFIESDGWAYLRSKQPRQIYVCAPAPVKIDEMATNPHRALTQRRLKRLFPGSDFKDVRPIFAEMRVIKQAPEIAALETATNITYQALNHTIKQLDQYATESALEGALTAEFRKHGATGHAYSPIVASAQNSCTLHYVKNSTKLNTGQVLLFDVGAEYSNYAADISRTVVIGRANKRQQSVIQAVAVAQAQIVEKLKPGLTFKELSEISTRIVGVQLQQLGLINDSADTQAVRAYFPHSVSHFLGLDVHDIGDYTKPLSEGMVITVEPGIYIPEESIGVRIEDDYLITKKGARQLGKALPAVL